ncbi:hypothetical protein BJF78_28930 [Pseudonocardia sp. CNS-139]|nr:hypothetical protein BJF78_28930 [Pseudonocardia sp. CNS-139]
MAGPVIDHRTSTTRRGMQTLVVTSLSAVLVFGTLTAINVALPAMAADLGAAAGTADWFLIAFMLANTAFILVFGRLSDTIGRRPLYLGGVGLFTVAGLVCAAAPDAGTVIAMRLLQGVGAACAVSNSTAVLTDAFPPHRLAFGLSLNIVSGAVSSLLGPLVGGLLVDGFGWRSIFLAGGPLGLLAVGLGWYALRGTHRPRGRRDPYDGRGALLSCAGLAAVLLAVNRASVWGPADARVVLLFGLGVAALVAFVLVERRVPAPLLDLSLVAGRRALRYAAAFFAASSFSAVLVLVVLYRQVVEGASATEAGLAALPMGLAMLAAAGVAGALARRVRIRTLATAGAVVMAAGLAALTAELAAPGTPAALTLRSSCSGSARACSWRRSPRDDARRAGRPPRRRQRAAVVMHNGAQALSTAAVLLVVALWTGPSYAAGSAPPDAHVGFAVAALVLTGCALAGAVCAAFQPPDPPPAVRPAPVVTGTRRGDEPCPSPIRS